ncbi:putative polysaccharide biosynthesis protein [Bacillus norwichensis]|uniref:Polysaccharide biosynthesis protein n=1 Tax=Bacillus norwichensis TaxID=2762217 RepID=A0ABR8VIN9_9BACI|nr:polysaccharide biosynthesis protein [Bacillus norwichensis]MBD8004625.1 polysaccharide biosynthesis protein [Bacillus norwichensis]
MSSKLIKGAMILTLGSVLSKILGLLYVIPLNTLLGKDGVSLYAYAYVPYTIFMSIATAGIPLAVSKIIAKYNSVGQYSVSQRIFKLSFKIMLITGVLSFFVMFATAPFLAEFGSFGKKGLSKEDLTTVIRAVSFALILVPAMSIIRGFFQGHEDMKPTAVSQVVEQIVRIIFLLSGAFVVLIIFEGKLVTAVSLATFAATIGAIASMIILVIYLNKQIPFLKQLADKDQNKMESSMADIQKEIFLSSIPFVVVGIAMPLFQFVDNLTFSRAMASIGLDDIVKSAFGILNFNTQKLVVIPMTLATAFSMSLIPALTSSYASGNMEKFCYELDKAFQIVLFITIPAVIGISILAGPIYTVFYGSNPLGTEILAIYAPAAILFAIFSISAAVLQGINMQKMTVLSLSLGLLTKCILNISLIKTFETAGAVYATTLGYLVACLLNLFFIYYSTEYKYTVVVKRSLLMFIFTAIMAGAVFGAESVLSTVMDPESRWQSILIIVICVSVGVGIYGLLALKSNLANMLFGRRIHLLREKLNV